MRALRRFYRRNRTLVTWAVLCAASMALVGHVTWLPGADSLFTPVSGVSSFVLSPAAGGALLWRQRSRRAIRWDVVAVLLGASMPMLWGYFRNEWANLQMPTTLDAGAGRVVRASVADAGFGDACVCCRCQRSRWWRVCL